MSRSVKQDYPPKIAVVSGRGSGKSLRAKQTAAQYARDQIASGVDPSTTMVLAGPGPLVHRVTYGEAAEWAFVGDIIDREMKSILERETS